MRVCSAEALLVDVGELSRGDRVVSFLSAEHGRLRGVAKGAQRKYSRFSGQLQPLATVQLTWFEKESSDLVRIRDLEMVHTAEALRRDLEGLLLTSYVAEHLSVFAQEREASPELYRLTRAVVQALEQGAEHDLILRYFEAWVLRLAGLLAYELDCPECGVPLAERAVLPDLGETLVCTSCSEAAGAEGMLVLQGTLELVRASRSLSPSRFAAFETSAASMAQLEEVLTRIRRRFLGFELKSHGVIAETFRRLQRVERGA